MKGKRHFFYTTVKRVVCISALTAFAVSTATIVIFFYSFRDVLVSDVLRRVVEETIGYRVYLGGIRKVSFGAVSVERVDLAIGSTTFSSGPTEVGFRLGVHPLLKIRRIVTKNPSIFVDLSQGGEGTGGGEVIDRLMGMDIEVTEGDLTLIEKDKRYMLVGVDMSYEEGLLGGTFSISGSARTEGVADGVILGGRFRGRVYVTGRYPDITARGTIRAEGAGWRIDRYLFSWGGLDAHISLDRDVVGATDVTVTGLSITNDDLGLRLDGITAAGEIRSENDGPFVLRGVKLSAPRLGDVDLDLKVLEDGQWEVSAASDSLRLSAESLRDLGDLVPDFLGGWAIKGRVQGTLAMGTVGSGDGGIVGDLEAGLIDAGFLSPDSVYLGEGISGTVWARFKDDKRRGFSFDTRLTAHDFGLLLSDFFVNFEKRQISARAAGTLVENGGVRDLECEVSIPSVLVAHVSGDIDFGPTNTGGLLSCRLTTDDMGLTYDLFIRNFFKNRIPSLYGGHITGSFDWRGTIAGDLSAPRISGDLTIDGSSIDLPDIDTKVEGLSVSLPFSVDLSGRTSPGPSPRFVSRDFGRVTFSRAVVRGVEVGGTTLSPALKEGALSFRDDVALSVSGGSVVIGDFTAADIFGEDRSVNLFLDISGVDIARLFPMEEAVNLKGELSGRLSEVRIAEKKLFTSGLLTAKIFNGQVNIGEIWGQDIFDAARRLGCDVTFSGIDLGALTQTIDVGKVTGIAQGGISDMVFSYGGPERFVFDVSTVEKPGIRKRVSVDFVEKLTILGSGSNFFSGVLRGGLNRFVHDYNYSKIGIHLELKDDYFTLRGMIHEGNKEFFIKRSGPTGINVINQNPDNRIRFKDMIERLERINVKNTEDIRIEKQ